MANRNRTPVLLGYPLHTNPLSHFISTVHAMKRTEYYKIQRESNPGTLDWVESPGAGTPPSSPAMPFSEPAQNKQKQTKQHSYSTKSAMAISMEGFPSPFTDCKHQNESLPPFTVKHGKLGFALHGPQTTYRTYSKWQILMEQASNHITLA